MKYFKNLFDKNISSIIVFIVISLPILDVLTSICLNVLKLDITIGSIVKAVYLLIFLVLIYLSREKKSIIFVSLLLLIAGIHLILIYFNFDLVILKYEISNTFRVLFFPITLIFLYLNRKSLFGRENYNFILITAFLYSLCIIIPYMFSIDFNAYDVAKAGSKGLYNSANEVSAIISLLFPLSCAILYKNYKKIFPYLVLIFLIFSALILGTKSGYLSMFLTIFFITLLFIYKKTNRNRVFSILNILVIIIIGCFLFSKTTAYENTRVHMKYFGIDNYYEIFNSFENVDNIIFSERLSLLLSNLSSYSSSSFSEKLFGLGYYVSGDVQRKIIEMDLFDILVVYGVVFVFIYLLIIIFYIKKIRIKNFSFYDYCYLISFSLSILLIFFTGHILTVPSVSMLLALIIIYLINKSDIILKKGGSMKKKVLFCSYSMGYGGIEKSLLTLLKNFDYDCYDVTLILEKKEGVFLEEVPKCVRVKEFKVSEAKLFGKIFNTLNYFKFYWCNKNKYDFSCAYSTYSKSGSRLVRIASKNSALFVHSDYTKIYDEDDLKEFVDGIKIENFKTIIFVSNEAKANLKKYISKSKKCLVINNLVDYKSINIKSKEKLIKDKGYILFVGRLEEKSKRVSKILKLAMKLKNYNFILIGDGPDRKKYEEYISKNKIKNVKLLGALKNPYPYIKNASYIILTSDYEGFPVVYNEAILLGTPIITTCDVTDDVIKIEEGFGYIVSKDFDEMFIQVRNILKKVYKPKSINFEEVNNNRLKEFYKVIMEEE